MRTRSVAAQLKPFALKFFFSNQYLYASIQRRVDGRVSARLRRVVAPSQLGPHAQPPAPPGR